jgi:hypothetical protein
MVETKIMARRYIRNAGLVKDYCQKPATVP